MTRFAKFRNISMILAVLALASCTDKPFFAEAERVPPEYRPLGDVLIKSGPARRAAGGF